MKTRIALYIYYLSISLLTVCAIGIVVKLLFWPPCTQTGNTCVIEPWSVAGLAGTVLAVAATVLAILGAVAVAAWWTSLNDRVNEQVRNLYKEQSKESVARFEQLLHDQGDTAGRLFNQVATEFAELRKKTTQLDEDLEKVTAYSRAITHVVEQDVQVGGYVVDLIRSLLAMLAHGSSPEILEAVQNVIARIDESNKNDAQVDSQDQRVGR